MKKNKKNNMNKLTPKQALKEIQSLKYRFIGNREQLHDEIDKIIAKVK